MTVELHLPDLPEVPIALGYPLGPAREPGLRQPVPWLLRLRDALSAYLPLLLMTALALFTWWLVKNTPVTPDQPGEAVVRHDPDYTMTQFALERFDATGRLKVRVQGRQMRHYPDVDRIEADDVQIRAIAPDGRVTLASARHALSNGDGSELQLFGQARVTSSDASGQPLTMEGEFLHVFLVSEKVRSPLPVQVTLGDAVLTAAGLDYDHGARRLDLKGPMRALIPPHGAPAP